MVSLSVCRANTANHLRMPTCYINRQGRRARMDLAAQRKHTCYVNRKGRCLRLLRYLSILSQSASTNLDRQLPTLSQILYYLRDSNGIQAWVEERNGRCAGRMISRGLRWDRTMLPRPSIIAFRTWVSCFSIRHFTKELRLILLIRDDPCWVSLSLTVGRQALSWRSLMLR